MNVSRKISSIALTMIVCISVNSSVISASEKNKLSLKVETNIRNVTAYKASNLINNAKDLKVNKDSIEVNNLEISDNGYVGGEIKLNNGLESLNINGTLFKDFNNKKNYYAQLKTDNPNYDIVHFSFASKGENSMLTNSIFKSNSLNIYIKNKDKGNIDFFEIEIDDNYVDKLETMNDKLDYSGLEDTYWFTKVLEPESSMTSEVNLAEPKAATIRSVNYYPTLTWKYTSVGKVYNMESKYKLNSRMVQTGDQVRGELSIQEYTLKENGKIVSTNSSGKLTRIKGMWGSQAKVESIDFVSTNGSYIVKQSPIHFQVSARKQIAPGVLVTLRPNYGVSASSSYPRPVKGYEASFESKNGSFYEMRKINDYLYSGILVNGSDGGANSYVGKNVTFQSEFTFTHGEGSTLFSTNIYAPMRTNTN